MYDAENSQDAHMMSQSEQEFFVISTLVSG